MARTDSKVIIDKYLEHQYDKVIVKTLIDGDATHDTCNSQYDNTVTEGKMIPVIEVANCVIKWNEVEYCFIQQRGFLSHLTLRVRNRTIGKLTSVNSSTIATVVLVPRKEGVYNTIKMLFYCLQPTQETDEIWTFEGDLIVLRLNAPIWFSQKPCTTYECFKQLCTDIDMGFVTVGDCEGVDDTLLRFAAHRNPVAPKEVFTEQITHSGNDTDAVFDCWVDFTNNIVLANVYDLLNNGDSILDLKIQSLFGNDTMDNTEPMTKYVEHERIITNYSNYGGSDLFIKSYSHDILNDAITKYGTQRNSCYMAADGSNDMSGNNMLDNQLKYVLTNTDSSNTQDYGVFVNRGMWGTEMSEDGNSMSTIEFHEQYINQMRTSYLKVVMNQPNFGLFRGELVGVAIFEKEKTMYMVMNRELDNVLNFNGSTDTKQHDNPRDLIDDNSEVLNIQLSGLYYIDRVNFEYTKSENPNIIQALFLIKVGGTQSYFNKYTETVILK